jgi:hypothetical protein
MAGVFCVPITVLLPSPGTEAKACAMLLQWPTWMTNLEEETLCALFGRVQHIRKK